MTSTESIISVATEFLTCDVLLAAKDGLLQSEWGRTVAWILGLIVVMGTAWGASTIAGSIRSKGRARQPSKTPEPKDVFEEICDAHGLSLEEKSQLLAGTVSLNLESPALLFVDSGLLNQLATSERGNAGGFRMLADPLFPPDVVPSKADRADLS